MNKAAKPHIKKNGFLHNEPKCIHHVVNFVYEYWVLFYLKVTENYWKINIPYVSISLEIKNASRKSFIKMDCMALKCHLESLDFYGTHCLTDFILQLYKWNNRRDKRLVHKEVLLSMSKPHLGSTLLSCL